MDSSRSFRCFLVDRDETGRVQGRMASRSIDDLPPGEVRIRVHWSSLNYKDALAATGHPGVAPQLPHVPGIDAAGVVDETGTDTLRVGQKVIVTGYELGAERWGAWSQQIRVPADWVIPLPPQLTLRQAMIYGTAGFTAAQCVARLMQHEVVPESGPVAVTGATGGVGCLAVQLLAQLGYSVAAVTGKTQLHDWLSELGAAKVLAREDVLADESKPMASTRWAGAVDTVGGRTLTSLVRATKVGGCVAACGLVGGHEIAMTVYPFILRGVTLAGVTSALCPRPMRDTLWKRLAADWRIADLEKVASAVQLHEVGTCVPRILAGEVYGRVIVRVAEE